MALPAPLADVARSEAALRTFLHGLPGVDQVGADARARCSAPVRSRPSAKAVGHRPGHPDGRPDHAGGRRHPGQGAGPVRQGPPTRSDRPDCPAVAAVCVYPSMVADRGRRAARQRHPPGQRGDRVPVRPGAAGVKLDDTRAAVAAGADEIDMVINRGAFLSGRYLEVFDEIVAVKQACGDAHLKVILETGELATYDNVRRASWLAMLAGGDFIKTSTGKVTPAATLPVTLVMLEAVRDFRGRDRPPGRGQAGRRHPDQQGRHQVPGDGERDGRRGLAATRTGSGSAPPPCSTTC